jgi:nitroreductase
MDNGSPTVMEISSNFKEIACAVRRAVKAFEPIEIPQVLREQILDAARHAPSSFNMQPYRFFWVESSPRKATAAKLCLGQMPAATASALVVAVADIGSLAATSQAQLEWMRRSGFSRVQVRDYERTARGGGRPKDNLLNKVRVLYAL